MAVDTIVVAGALANKPGNGGEAWVRLSWIRGLAALGFDVWFVEEIAGVDGDLATSMSATWFASVAEQFGLGERAVLVAGDEVLGADGVNSVDELLSSAALLVNISGNLRRPELVRAARRSAYVDLDPGFTQIWHGTGVGELGLAHHDLHFTVGAGIGRPGCPFPTGGFAWRPVRQPVVLEDWPLSPLPDDGAFTTVATWRGPFGPATWDGVTYGLKVHEFRKILDLPEMVSTPVELALAIHDGDRRDRNELLRRGWRVRDAASVSSTPDAFRSYVQSSRGELSVAQGIYVHGRTGWFSDRSVRYLASGRPVIVQDTGLAESGLPVGEGLLSFADAESAAAAVRAVGADPERHAKAARSVAETFFAASTVMAEFVTECGL